MAGNLKQESRFLRVSNSGSSMPAEWSAVLGDAIHNFRACLDHMMWAMTKMNGGKTGTWTQFPILPDPDWALDTRWRARQSIEEISRPHQAIVKAAQPYQGWNGPGLHPLAELDKLEITDKHREFNIVEILPVTTRFRVIESRDLDVVEITPMGLGKRLNPDTVIAQLEVTPTGPKPYIDVQADFAPEIEFENGRSVIDTLEVIRAYIDIALLRPLMPNLKSGWARRDDYAKSPAVRPVTHPGQPPPRKR